MPQLMLLIILLAAISPAVALGKDTRTTDHAAVWTYETRERSDRGTFSSADRNLIRAWLLEAQRQETTRQPAAELPPGLQKKVARGKPLPPGWQRKLTRGERLNHEYYSWGRGLPDDLLRRLSPPPPGSEILQIEDRIIRLDAATRTILDVFGLSGQ